MRVRDIKPMVIGITEVNAKNSVNVPNPAEYTMDWSNDYNMFHVNIDNCTGRGVLLYIHNSLQAEEVKMTVVFEENLFVKIKANSTECLLVGVIYRSPSENSKEKNAKLRELLAEVSDMKFKHYIIMGDFNYPSIDWEIQCAKRDNSDEQKFIDCLRDNFLFQIIDRPTRWRGTNIPNILDLVITKDETAVEDLEYQSPLGKSDYCVVYFNYVCSVILRSREKRRRNYKKANFTDMKYEISNTDWDRRGSKL